MANTTTEPKNNYKEFLSIISLKTITDKFKPNPKAQIQAVAQNLLMSDNFDSYFTLVTQGYEPTVKQQAIVDKYIATIFEHPCNGQVNEPYKQKPYLFLEKHLANGLQLNFNNIKTFLTGQYLGNRYAGIKESQDFFTNKDYILKATTGKYDKYHQKYTGQHVDLPYLTAQVRNTINNDDFSHFLLKDFNKFLNTKIPSNGGTKYNPYQYIGSIYDEILNFAPQLLFQHMPVDEFMKMSNKFKNVNGDYNQHVTTTLNNIYNTVYVEHFKGVLKETKTNYSTDLVKTLTLDNMKAQLTSETHIPKSALQIIENVESLYNKIQKHTDLQNYTNEIAQLDIILEKRIPEVLTKFLTIDPSYRTSLVNTQGKNAEQLMLESLETFKDSFKIVFETMNQHSVNSLSATNRYAQSIKM